MHADRWPPVFVAFHAPHVVPTFAWAGVAMPTIATIATAAAIPRIRT
jgi:hypothetical protein